MWGVKAVEDQAHQFAAAFLMPAKDIAHKLPKTVDWPTLFERKRTWQVSLAAPSGCAPRPSSAGQTGSTSQQ